MTEPVDREAQEAFDRWFSGATGDVEASYQLLVRVFTMGFRAARTCPECGRGRVQLECLCGA